MMPLIRFRLADVQYAFLEAFHVAGQVDESPANEALHPRRCYAILRVTQGG